MAKNESTSHTPEFFQALPKVDLHRHLEGSLRYKTVREVVGTHELDLPLTPELESMVQMQESDPFTFETFLSKFVPLRKLYRSQEIIRRITDEAIADAAADNVRYLELRFTPVALSKAQGFPLVRVIDWVIEATRQAEKTYGITTRLIVSLNRHEGIPLAAQVAYLAQERVDDGVVGLDLAGYEPGFPPEPFQSIFYAAKENGLNITVHAGEWDAGERIAEAIEVLGADRIGHGIRVVESPKAVAMALEHNTLFEVCPTSNHHSGAVTDLSAHPFKEMLRRGLNVSLNTDDPGISQITLSHEYEVACNLLGISLATLKERILAAGRAAFMPPDDRALMLAALETELRSLPTMEI